MSDTPTPEERFGELESRIAHQDGVIEDLNETITRQWDELDKLTRQIGRLNDRVVALEGDLQSVLPKDRPPPHY